MTRSYADVFFTVEAFCPAALLFFAVADLFADTGLRAGFLLIWDVFVVAFWVFVAVLDFLAEALLMTGFLFTAACCACF